MTDEKNLTPLMRQYFEIKNTYPDTILFFQVGDFYELFFQDAQKAAAILGIALTQRGTYKDEPIPLCGVPLHVVDHYLSKLVRAGFKIALCDQLEQPRPGKVVERGVTQVLTPGTLTDTKLLDAKSASYLAIFFPTETSWTFICAELLTGQLFVTIFTQKLTTFLDAELQRFMPDEIVVPRIKLGEQFGALFQAQGYVVSYENYGLGFAENIINCSEKTDEVEDQRMLIQEIQTWFSKQFHHTTVSWEQLQQKCASFQNGMILLYTYLKRNNEQALHELKQLTFYKPEDYVLIDAVTQRNLELVKNSQDGSAANTLFSILDTAVTAMGSRMIKKWLLRPLIKKAQIEERLSAVEWFVRDHMLKSELRKILQNIGDLERIVGRIALRRAQLYDYQALLNALDAMPSIKSLLVKADEGFRAKQKLAHIIQDDQKDVQFSTADHADHVAEGSLLSALALKIYDFSVLEKVLQSSLNDDGSKEWLIKQGYDTELDRLRKLIEQGSQAVLALEAQEQKTTGISSLKIKYNQVHGYGIEITNTHKALVPAHYLRIQTLANRERFTTQELKNLEHDLQRARNEINQVEKEVFDRVKMAVEQYVPALKKLSHALAYTDALASLADVAYTHNYIRPTFNDERAIRIIDGRHPVIERRLLGKFIPNTLELDDSSALWLITGPNMGGKSTFLRQNALITLMAQMGSFVPAKQADMSLVDRIFTRIGAADNMAEGKSTFLVEMEETALICNQATRQSLVILDEVGRGTSTFDGLAIAQAVVEYLYETIQARCLFATHYHELTALSERFPGIKSYFAASTKVGDRMILLHKIKPGIADGSFGLEVAAMAQLPVPLINRAREILAELKIHQSSGTQQPHYVEQPEIIPARPIENHIVAELAQLDSEALTAKRALELIWRWKESL